jgi:hypothetical protein
MRIAKTPLLVVCAVFGARSAAAEPHKHDGLYVGVAGGLGYYSATSDFDDSTAKGVTAPSGSVFVGGAIVPGLILGAGLIADYSSTWRRETIDGTRYPNGAQLIWSIGAFADYYVDAKRGGIHVQAFIGRGVLDNVGGVPDSDPPTGLTVMVGGGYDVWITPSISVGGLIRLTYGSYDCCYDPVSTYSTYAPSLLGTLTWQ